MSIITTPFVTTEEIAMWLPALLKGNKDFTTDTTPSKSMVETYLVYIESQILSRFQSAGYKIPFEVLPGETWPTNQNTYLKFLAILGVSQWAGKWVLMPAPTSKDSEGSRGSIFEANYKEELNKIFDGRHTTLMFRADFYIGTPAETTLTTPKAPMITFEESDGLAKSTHTLFDYTISKELSTIYSSVFGAKLTIDNLNLVYGNINKYPTDDRVILRS